MRFVYPDLRDPIFSQLRNEAGFDKLPEDDIEKALWICSYVHRLFEHDADNVPTSFDSLTILREAREGKSFRCLEYSILAQGLLLSYAIPARVVGLKAADVETREYGAGHVVVELWDHKKLRWYMCDVQWGIALEYADNLMSAVELGQALKEDRTVKYRSLSNSRIHINKEFYSEWIGEYLYFYDCDIEVFHKGPYHGLQGARKLMLVPPGVKPPKVFQNSFIMNLEYTHKIKDFYEPFQI